MKKRVGSIVLVVILAGGIFNIAYGLSSYKTQFNTRYGTAGSAIDQCILCHASNTNPQIPSTETPPNPYGVALEGNGLNFAAIESLDSDGDGFNNITEINARTFPGNSASRPATTDTTPPSVSAFTIPATSTSLTVSITTFTATDNVAVTGYMVTESVTAPLTTATGWSATAPTSYTAATSGAKTLYAWAKDAAGNVSASRSASVTITLPDATAPTVSAFTIPATSTSLTVSITSFTATDNVAVTGYMVTESATAPLATATGWTATAPTSYTAATAGAKTLYAWAKDAAGNVSTSRSASVTITLPPTTDTTPPTITAFSVPTSSTSLTVPITTFAATDNVGVTGYMVTESATAPLATATGWTATAPTSYTAATAGAKSLYAWAKDAAGNVSANRSASVTITLTTTTDTTPPTITVFSVPGTSSSLTVPITSFTATDNVGVTGYMVTESFIAPSATAAGWSITAPTSYTTSAAGYKYLYAWTKDAAGNVSSFSFSSFALVYFTQTSTTDTALPSVTAFTIPATSTSLTVPITTFTATDNVGVTGYMVTESAIAPIATATGWSATVPTSYTAATVGAKTLYAWAKDGAGNVSASRSASVTITLTSTTDTAAPTITAFSVPTSSTSLTVPITSFTATDNVGVTGYMITESATAPVATAAGWNAAAPTSYTTSSAGYKYLYAWAKDAAGNVSSFSFSSFALVYFTQASTTDTALPSVTAFTIPATSTSLTVPITTFTATDNVGVTGYMITESAIAPVATATGWSATAPTSYTAATVGAKTLYAWAKDGAGNVSASRSASVTITFPTSSDSTPPTITSFRLPATSSSLTVPVTLAARDDVGVTGYLIKTDSSKPSTTSLLWKSTSPTSFTFRTPGTKTLYAWAKDAAGNISPNSSATVTVSQPDRGINSATRSGIAAPSSATASAPATSAALPSTASGNTGSTTADGILPSITSFTVPANSISLTVTISSFKATDNLRVMGYMVTESPSRPSPTDPNWRPSAPTSYRFTTPGTKTLYAWVKDSAGNVSASRTAVVRISLPTSTPSPASVSPRSNIKK